MAAEFGAAAAGQQDWAADFGRDSVAEGVDRWADDFAKGVAGAGYSCACACAGGLLWLQMSANAEPCCLHVQVSIF